MMRNRLAKVVLTVGALHSGLVSALGLGELTLDSTLNQPFRAEIPLRDIGELDVAQIRVQLADASAFENAGVDRSQFLSSLQFQIEVVGSGNGRIIVTTEKAVVEPYLDFIVEARWPNGKMIREYTVLLDLPVYADDSPARAVNPSVASPAPKSSLSTPVQSQAPARELGGAIGAVDRAPPTARSVDRQQELPPADSPATEYRVQHHDTMWRIAGKLRPSSYVTTQQTMLALLKKNPQAFVNGNVNQIKSGYVLRLPTEDEVRQVDHQEAVEEIQLQAKEWRGERVARSTTPKASAAASSSSSATPMAPQIDATAKSPSEPTSDTDTAVKFSLGSAGSTDSGDELDAMRDQIRVEKENLEKTQLENSAMQNRVVEMEKQIQTLQSLIELKNSQLAALQNGQQVPDASAISDEAEAEAMAPAVASDASAETDSATDVAVAPKVDADAKPATEKPAAANKPAAVKTPVAQAQNWLSENLMLVLGFVLGLLALLVLFIRRRNSAEDDADLAAFDDDLSDKDSIESPVLFASGGEFDRDSSKAFDAVEAGDDPEAVFSSDDFNFDDLGDDSLSNAESTDSEEVMLADDAALGGEDESEGAVTSADAVIPQTGDVVAEAEIYVAYGRYDQAASLLKTAISQDPENAELRLKLIDIYLDTRDQDNFELAYQDLLSLNNDSAVARVKESMSAIEGVSHWLGDESQASDNTVDVSRASVAVDAADELDFDIAGEAEEEIHSLSDDDIDFELDEPEANATPLEPSPISNINESGTIDDIEPGTDSDTLESLDVDLADLDFDFDGDFGGASGVSEEVVEDVSTPSPLALEDDAPVVETVDAEDDDVISFDEDELGSFELDDLASSEPKSGDEDTLEFDIGASGLGDSELSDIAASGDELGAELEEQPEQVLEPLAEEESVDLDLSDLDMDLAEPAQAPSVSDLQDDEDEIDLELSDFDMPLGEVASTEPVSSVDDELEIDETFFTEDDANSDASLEFAETPAQESDAPAESSSTSSEAASPVDEAISVEDLVFDEFDAGEEEAEGFDALVDAESVATKLDLARAYIDMGDSEGAREMLEEVLQEGDIQQQSDAQTLLDNIG
jgi:pilus assembly protein FimV